MEDVKNKVDSGGSKGCNDGGNEDNFDKDGNKTSNLENNDRKSASPEQKHASITKLQVEAATFTERYNMFTNSRVSSSNQKEQKEKLESARAEMGEVREENQRLKMHLDQIMKDYRTLQMQFHDIIQKEDRNKSTSQSNNNIEAIEESELVSLSLGRFSSETKDQKEENFGEKLLPQSTMLCKENDSDHEQDSKGLSLGLDCKFEAEKSSTSELPFAGSNASPLNCSDEGKEEAGETWPPSKHLKTSRSGDDEVLQQNPVKKARVSVRARCETPTMNDGCQWRKYGQKIAKGNPCPRAYYRCTVAQSCPVRKQVQRCPEDMSILVTTYEGTHNHPLPISATAMASTTSAAASMLLSGSTSTSRTSPSSSTTAAAVNLHGLNFYLSDYSGSKQFYLHNSSSLSPSPSHPTVTLDLTSTPNSSSLFNRFSSSTYPPIPKFSSTSLSFSSSSESNWGGNSFFTYGSGGASANSATSQLPFVRNQLGSINQPRPDNILNYQSYIQRNNNAVSAPPTQQQQMTVLPDTIAAATKAITADPSFQSALAAALQSIIGAGNNSNAISGGDQGHVQKVMKWGESHFPVTMSSNYSSASNSNGNACATSYLNRATSTSSHQGSGSGSGGGGGGGGGSLMFLPPSSLPKSSPASTSTSPGDDGEPS